MTRKHFVMIAQTMNHNRPKNEYLVDDIRYHQWAADVESLANRFALQFDRFDRTRFIEACKADGKP